MMAEIPRTGFIWHELMTTDTEGAERFYREVTGLTTTPGPYRMLMDGDQPVGGLVGPTPEGPVWPSGGPEPHYLYPKRLREVCEPARAWSAVLWVIDGVLVVADDLDVRYRRARQACAVILSEPENGPPARQYRAEDPDGRSGRVGRAHA
jgi:catechol 2,3-dioxygenase-like lactoylglutathione lyase family enzyme